MSKILKIGSKEVQNFGSSYIIGEIGINHNGCMDRARALVDMAVDAGCDAVKFQKRHLPSLYTSSVLNNLENHEQGFQYLIPILKDYELTDEQMSSLCDYSRKQGIEFLCTPFDKVSAEFVESLGVPGFKLSSADLTNLDLLEKLAGFGKPLFLSTGMSTEEEIDKTVAALRGWGADFALLHCVSCYPVDASEASIGRIAALQEKYDVPIGYSGHDIGTVLSVVAVSLGAAIVEKHITLDRSLRGPDHKVSLLPPELRELVGHIREAERARTRERGDILQGELLNKLVFRKSVVAAKPIKKGETITREMLINKSPGTGLCGQRIGELLGAAAPRDYQLDDLFTEADLDPDLQEGEVVPPEFGTWGMVVRYHDFESALKYKPKSLEFHFTYGDTTLDIPHEKFEKYADQLKGLTLRAHCCEYIGERLFDLCSKYDDVLDETLETLQKVIDTVSTISQYFNGDKPRIVTNVGAMTLKERVRDTNINPERLHRLINTRIDPKNCIIAMQNMPPNPWYFGGQWKGHYFLRKEELVAFAEETGHKVCLDLSHAQMACSYRGWDFGEYIATLKPYVEHVHVADATGIEGEGTQIDTGDVDFQQFFSIYSDYQGTWIPEIWQGHVNDHQGARLALVKLARHLEAARDAQPKVANL